MFWIMFVILWIYWFIYVQGLNENKPKKKPSEGLCRAFPLGKGHMAMFAVRIRTAKKSPGNLGVALPCGWREADGNGHMAGTWEHRAVHLGDRKSVV